MAPEQHQWRRSGVFIVNLEYISHLFHLGVSIVDFVKRIEVEDTYIKFEENTWTPLNFLIYEKWFKGKS